MRIQAFGKRKMGLKLIYFIMTQTAEYTLQMDPYLRIKIERWH